MVVHFTEDHDEFAFDIFDAGERVVFLAGAEGRAVDVGGEVADSGKYARVEGAPVCEVAAETHT